MVLTVASTGEECMAALSRRFTGEVFHPIQALGPADAAELLERYLLEGRKAFNVDHFQAYPPVPPSRPPLDCYLIEEGCTG